MDFFSFVKNRMSCCRCFVIFYLPSIPNDTSSLSLSVWLSLRLSPSLCLPLRLSFAICLCCSAVQMDCLSSEQLRTTSGGDVIRRNERDFLTPQLIGDRITRSRL